MKEEFNSPLEEKLLNELPLNLRMMRKIGDGDRGKVSLIRSDFHKTNQQQSFHFYKLVGRHCPFYFKDDE